MQWVYRSLMAVSVVMSAAVAAGLLRPEWAAVATAVGTSAGYFSDRALANSGIPNGVPTALDDTPTVSLRRGPRFVIQVEEEQEAMTDGKNTAPKA